MSSSNNKIAFISQPEYYRFMYENCLSKDFITKEFRLVEVIKNPNATELIEFDAHINIFFRGELLPNDILESLSGLKINLSSEPFPCMIENHPQYSWDLLRRYLEFRHIRTKPFDYIFHIDKHSLPFMEKDGLHLSGEFIYPVALDVYRPILQQKNWDLFFIGRSTRHRERFFGSLKNHYNFLHIAHGMWGQELVEYINASKICLNIHAEKDHFWEPRMQMMLACGAFVISEPIPANEILQPGIHYIEVSSSCELSEAVEYFLRHKQEREAISQSGYQQVCEKLDSITVFNNFISDIQADNYEKYQAGSSNITWDIMDSSFQTLKNIKQTLRNMIKGGKP